MTKINTRRGFTLIELLVVILIIGILAAVAVPQYNKAVLIAKTRKMIVDLKAVTEAQQRYYLDNGKYAAKFSDLDITLGGYPSTDCANFSMFGNKTDCISNENSVLLISKGSVFAILALFNQGKYIRQGFVFRSDKLYCYYYPGEPGKANNFCKKVLNCTRIDDIGDLTNNYYTCPAF